MTDRAAVQELAAAQARAHPQKAARQLRRFRAELAARPSDYLADVVTGIEEALGPECYGRDEGQP